MRAKRVWLIATGFSALAIALPLVLGQQPATLPSSVTTVSATVPQSQPAPKRNPAKLSLLEREIHLAGQRGAEWLQRANRPDGRFVYGYMPALRAPMEGDHFLQQVEATLALARAARYYQDDRAAALARQAILRLLLETKLADGSPKGAAVRYPVMPSALVNRLAAAGLLVIAIHELPRPATDLLDRSTELCNYLRSQQRPDGSFILDLDKDGPAVVEIAATSYYTGPALYALTRSVPAPWKTEAVRKAHVFYAAWWREHKTMGLVPWHTAAYAEALLASKDPAMAETIFAMNDWLCGLQYQQLDPRRPLWRGGFKTWRDGQESVQPPEATSALYAESLVHACRAAAQVGDVRRWQRYKEAVERCLQFLTTLQYTDANTQHFASWYRPALVGAFHASHQDGDLRLEDTSRAVAALAAYLDAQLAAP